MFLFFHKKSSAPIKDYDSVNWEPVLRCSICTGEQTAGFRNKTTGHFREECLIASEHDLEEFKKTYGLDEVKKIY